jgi:hypothetical protein
MSQRNSASIWVCLFWWEAEIAVYRKSLGREGFVHFKDVDV